jgi:hypothetical protein
VHSATYAYFAKEAQPLFDIPRKNRYGVNVRFYECKGLDEAAVVYDKFAEVGEPERKRTMSVGEKGTLYVVPDEKNPMMGNYYITALLRNYVMQVHSDDGFVLMDITGSLSGRLLRKLGIEGHLANGVTLLLSKDGYINKAEFITFGGDNITDVVLSGTVYDQANRRLPGVLVTVRETGDAAISDRDGNYELTLSTGKDGDSVRLFSVINITAEGLPLESGYYRVDMGYKLQDKVSQNIWQLAIAADGRVTGSSLNLSDNVRLGLSGTITKEKIELTRDCGSSILGVCRQQLTAPFDKNMRLYRGSWSGSGGGGELLIYADTFNSKPVRLKAAEAGYKVNGKAITAGNKPQQIVLTPTVRQHTDFYASSARLMLTVKTQNAKATGTYALHLYKVDDKGKQESIGSTAPLKLSSKGVQAAIDITGIYQLATAKEYRIGFATKDSKAPAVQVDVAFEVDVAAENSKLNTAGTAKAAFVSLNSGDYASNNKTPAPDGENDMELSLDLSAYGGIVTGIELRSLTASAAGEKRQWNTDPASFYPVVSVFKGSIRLNNENGSIEYPLQQLNEHLRLYISKGSADVAKITGFEITITLDNGKVTIPVSN